MIVHCYVATFLHIMDFVLWRHSWKGDGKNKYPMVDISTWWYPNSM